MSWSISSVVVPASAICRSRWPRSALSARVESGRRLVEAQEPRPHGDRPCHTYELPLPLRQLGRGRVRQRDEIEQRERVVGGRGRLGTPTDELRRQRERGRTVGSDGQVLAHREVVEQLGALPRSSEAAARAHVRWQPVEVTTVELRAARVPDEAGDRVDEGRLARTVRPDQSHELAVIDDEVDVLHGMDAAEAHRQPGRGEHGAHAALARAFFSALAWAVL